MEVLIFSVMLCASHLVNKASEFLQSGSLFLPQGIFLCAHAVFSLSEITETQSEEISKSPAEHTGVCALLRDPFHMVKEAAI